MREQTLVKARRCGAAIPATRTRRAGGLVAAVIVAVAAGCTPATTSPGASTLPATSVTEAVPMVTAARGPELTKGPIGLRVPEGWSDAQDFRAAAVSKTLDSCGQITLANEAAPEVTLANMVTAYGTGSEWAARPERLPDPTIADVRWFHIHGQNGPAGDATGADVHMYGTYRVDRIVTVRLERRMTGKCSITEADLGIQWESVLATIHWT